MNRVLLVKADDLRPGDRVVGQGGEPYLVGPLTVRMLRDHNRDGQRLGPRIYWEEGVAAVNAQSDTVFEVEAL